MSKIGKQPVTVPSGVTVEVTGKTVNVSGPKGKLSRTFEPSVNIEVKDNEINVKTLKTDKRSLAIWGTSRVLVSNMVKGVSEGWSKQLELIGTGYRAEVRGNVLVLIVGYSHPIEIKAPEGVTFKVEKNIVTIEGTDREVVGQVAAIIYFSFLY